MIWIARKMYIALWFMEQIFGSKKFQFFRNSRETIFNKYILPTITKQQNVIIDVPVLHKEALTAEVLRSLPSDSPLVFKNIIPKEIVQSHDLEKIGKVYGDVNQAYSDSKKYFFNQGTQKLSDIIASVLSDKPEISLSFGDLIYQRKEALKNLKLATWFAFDSLGCVLNQTWQVFASGNGKFTKLHTELGNLLSLQLVGKKKWLIFAPKYSINAHPKATWRMYVESTDLLDIRSIEKVSRGLQAFYVELEAGDVLYCPSFFWHFVWSDQPSFSVAFKWTKLKSFIQYPFLTGLILTSRYPSIFAMLPPFKKVGNFHPPVG